MSHTGDVYGCKLSFSLSVSISLFLSLSLLPSLSFSLSLCLFLSVSGQWRVFSGNELGALLGWWLFRCWKQQNTDAAAVKNLYMLSSTVSSKILRAIALKEGFHFEVNTVKFKPVHTTNVEQQCKNYNTYKTGNTTY